MTGPVSSDIVSALSMAIDPELGVNIVDLGLVYGIERDGTRVRVTMTMTSPACSLGDYLADLVKANVKWRVPGIEDVEVGFTDDPPWTPDMMSDSPRKQLSDPDR